jgi:hypothetical protein
MTLSHFEQIYAEQSGIHQALLDAARSGAESGVMNRPTPGWW